MTTAAGTDVCGSGCGPAVNVVVPMGGLGTRFAKQVRRSPGLLFFVLPIPSFLSRFPAIHAPLALSCLSTRAPLRSKRPFRAHRLPRAHRARALTRGT